MICKKRSTYKFNYPNKSASLTKFTSLSEEYNIINIQQAGTGRKGSIYAFDYAYCVYKDLPTHYVKDSEKIDKTRDSIKGEPIQRIAQLTDEIIEQYNIRGKVDGVVEFWSEDTGGIAKGEDGVSYIVLNDSIIKSDKKKSIHIGSSLRFVASKMNNMAVAAEVEILN